MKILVLKSSGNKKGSSNMLADEFIKGVASNGHEITEYDVIRKNINPVMLTLAWNGDDETYAITKAYYDKICDYMQFENLGSVVGKGCGTPFMTAGSEYPKKAYELGLSI